VRKANFNNKEYFVKFNKKTAVTAARILLGAIFLLNGINGFLMLFTGKGFLPMPQMPAEAGGFMGALFATGYMFPTIKTIEVLCGLALVLGRYVPLALVLLAPIIVNIFLFHLFLAPGGIVLAIIIVGLALYLGHSYRADYKPILKKK
jgi:putative oxidoreductase